MQISFGEAVMNSKANVILLAAIAFASCSSRPEQPPVMKVDKPFAAAGSIEMQLDGGDYIIRAGPDERIRVSFAGNTGNAAADLSASGTHANLAIRDTPHSNFRATIELPQPVFHLLQARAEQRSSSIQAVILEAIQKEIAREPAAGEVKGRVSLPLIRSSRPGSLRSLTNTEIDDILG